MPSSQDIIVFTYLKAPSEFLFLVVIWVSSVCELLWIMWLWPFWICLLLIINIPLGYIYRSGISVSELPRTRPMPEFSLSCALGQPWCEHWVRIPVNLRQSHHSGRGFGRKQYHSISQLPNSDPFRGQSSQLCHMVISSYNLNGKSAPCWELLSYYPCWLKPNMLCRASDNTLTALRVVRDCRIPPLSE